MAFIRKIKKGDRTYLAKVESYREGGKVKQRVIEYIGTEVEGKVVQRVDVNSLEVKNVKHYADIKILYQLSLELKLNYLLGKHHKPIIALLIAHLICKGSIVKLNKWIESSTICEIIGLENLSTEMMYKALDYLNDCEFNRIEQSIFEYLTSLDVDDKQSFVLDVTDTYYNGKQDQSVLRKGKDGKVSKLIQIGLGVSFNNGFPIFHNQYSGNISNIKILEDLTVVMAQRGLKSVVMDRGFYSERNAEALHKLGIQMILGMKQSIGIKSQILSKIKRDEIYIAANQLELKNTTIYVKEQNFLFGKLIIIYNPKFEVLKRDKMLAELGDHKDVKFVGYSLIFHNTKSDAHSVAKKYFEKDIVERSFRTMKGEAALHPIRLWMPTRIKAHIKLCYLAMCLLSLIKFRCKKLEMNTGQIIENLQSIYKVNLQHTKTKKQFTKIVTASNDQLKIIKALKCSV